MFRSTLLNLAAITLLIALATSQALAFHFPEPTLTDANMSVLVTSTDIDGTPIRDGDEVGVFDPQGVCAGLGVAGDAEHGGSDEGFLGLALWADDPQTRDEDEGFVHADSIRYLVWDAMQEVEMVAEVTLRDGNNLTWSNNGFIVIDLHAEGFPIHRVAELEHDFGVLDMVIGEPVVWSTIIENIGNANLVIDTMASSGNWSRAEVGLESVLIVPDSSTRFLSYFPFEDFDVGDNCEGVVTLFTNAPDSLIQIHLKGRIGAPINEISTHDIFFGRVQLGSEMYGSSGLAFDSVVVRNSGDATLLISNLHCTTPAFYIPVGDTNAYSIPPGDSVVITVVFHPTAITEYAGRLTYESNSSVEPSSPSVVLHGIGIAPNGVDNKDIPVPFQFSLSAVYPNPFNGSATVKFTLPKSGNVRLSIFNLAGMEVLTPVSGVFAAGNYSVRIESKDLPTGSYLARVVSGDAIASLRFVVLK